MRNSEQNLSASNNDPAIRWAMRVTGIILALTASVLLAHDIFNGILSVGFLGICVALGTIILVTSFLPVSEKSAFQEQRVNS